MVVGWGAPVAARSTSALAQSRPPVDRRALEVTEGFFVKEGTGAIKVFERVLDLGVHLSPDHLGTACPSLGYLGRTRFSSITIDRSFVAGTSEGVHEALAMIRELGCTKAQDHSFAARFPSPRRGRSGCATAPTCARLDTSASRGQGRGHVGV